MVVLRQDQRHRFVNLLLAIFGIHFQRAGSVALPHQLLLSTIDEVDDHITFLLATMLLRVSLFVCRNILKLVHFRRGHGGRVFGSR